MGLDRVTKWQPKITHHSINFRTPRSLFCLPICDHAMPPKIGKRSHRSKRPKSKMRNKTSTCIQPEEVSSNEEPLLLQDSCISFSTSAGSETLSEIDDTALSLGVVEEEEGVRYIIVTRPKSSKEKEHARLARQKQLSEYKKREAALARRDRYNKRHGSAVETGPKDTVTVAPQDQEEDVDEQCGSSQRKKGSPKKVSWRRDSQLVSVNYIESNSDERAIICQQS